MFLCFRCDVKFYYLLIKFESTGEFNLKSSYIYSVNYNIVIFLTNVDNINIIMFIHKVFRGLILFLPNGDVELVYKKVVCFNFDQR